MLLRPGGTSSASRASGRNPSTVEAAQIIPRRMAAVAAWCGAHARADRCTTTDRSVLPLNWSMPCLGTRPGRSCWHPISRKESRCHARRLSRLRMNRNGSQAGQRGLAPRWPARRVIPPVLGQLIPRAARATDRRNYQIVELYFQNSRATRINKDIDRRGGFAYHVACQRDIMDFSVLN